MKLATTLARSLQADLQAELRDIEQAVAGAPAIKTATLTVTVEYETGAPLA